MVLRSRRSGWRRRYSLDHVMYKWCDGTRHTIREFLKSAAIFGQTGSGKSSGSNLAFVRMILSLRNSGGLVLGSKPEDREWWVRQFRKCGRIRDLIIFAPDQPYRCNFIDFEMKNGADAMSLTQFITVTGECLDADTQKGERFWEQGTRRQIYNAIVALMLSGEELSIPNIQRFISTAAYSELQLQSPSYQAGFFNQVMQKAAAATKNAIQDGDFLQCVDYWGGEFLHMDEKPRSSITAGTMNILHAYNTGIARQLFSTTTNVSPADMEHGKWIFVDLPLDSYGVSGKIGMHGFKLVTQRYILRRRAKPTSPVICIHCDEAGDVTNSMDAPFLAKCRSHNGCMIFLAQSIHSYFGEMQKEKAKALMTNFGIKCFHTVGDSETARYASDLLGKYEASKVNVSPRGDLDDEANCNIHTSWEDILQPNAFMSGLRSGGRANRYCVDGLVIKSGEPFRSGCNFLYQTFSQR